MSDNLETHLTRREMLKGLVAAMPLVPTMLNAFSPDSIVTYQEALNDKENINGLRQKYLEQLVRNSPYSQYVSRVVYDHNRSIANQENSYINKTRNNPAFLSKVINDYLFSHDPEFYGLSPESKSERRKKFRDSLDSEETGNLFNSFLKERTELLEKFNKDKFAITIPGSSGFGSGKGSTLYFFGDIFENKVMHSNNGTLNVPPSENYIKAMLGHEFIHAEDNFRGIHLPWFRAGNDNYLDIHPDILDIVKETRGYLKQFEIIRNSEKPDANKLLTDDIFKLPPSYVQTYFNFAEYLERSVVNLDPKILSPYDTDIVSNPFRDVSKKVLEMAFHQKVRKIFENFKAL